ncbi:chromate resistance protein ChrB domain-containing protein [Roseovarius pelagicus]|uniref:Chromate resistance protein n=1 Tax=Roseovarius pelagicus TaxID=2980108 RepID=A0ABY6DBE1_9RHOB|nr:chromate resistance protein ChrB domain-containing protein [Roseovarius pelagicus]UXX83451.1 chromate resistance protein [Roseovarius pelagicus]
MPGPNEITTKQLMRLVGTPDCPVIVDVRTSDDFADDPRMIPSAIRHKHTDLDGLIVRLAGRASVIVCQKGRKLSQGVVSWLQSNGATSEYLKGGLLNWRDAVLPLIPAAAVPTGTDGATRWITRTRPKIDRIACPWLIRRFVDREAKFLFVARSEVASAAEHFGATPFDIEGVHFSHRGDRCTFDTMIEEFELKCPALGRLALAVRAADTNRHDLHPVAPGLLAISVGLSRQYKDDQQQLKAGLALYDGLYRWARDGVDEGHDWPHISG